MAEHARTLADPISYPTITITVDDPATGMTTTITGKAKVDISTVATRGVELTGGAEALAVLDVFQAGPPPSLRLVADWQRQDNGRHYEIIRLPTPVPVTFPDLVEHKLTDGTLCTIDGPHPCADCTA